MTSVEMGARLRRRHSLKAVYSEARQGRSAVFKVSSTGGLVKRNIRLIRKDLITNRIRSLVTSKMGGWTEGELSVCADSVLSSQAVTGEIGHNADKQQYSENKESGHGDLIAELQSEPVVKTTEELQSEHVFTKTNNTEDKGNSSILLSKQMQEMPSSKTLDNIRGQVPGFLAAGIDMIGCVEEPGRSKGSDLGAQAESLSMHGATHDSLCTL